MSKEDLKVTPEALAEAYKILGVSTINKAEDPKLSKAEDEESDEDEGSDEDEMEDKKENKKKGKKMEKSETPDLSKAIETLGENLNKKFEAIALINKGLIDELSSTREELSKAQERIEEIETSSAGRKSITTTSFIEKAFQENETSGKKMLSMSQHKPQIQNMLIEKAGYNSNTIEKANVDSFWENEMQYFEATNSLHPKAIEKLFKEDNIQLVK